MLHTHKYKSTDLKMFREIKKHKCTETVNSHKKSGLRSRDGTLNSNAAPTVTELFKSSYHSNYSSYGGLKKIKPVNILVHEPPPLTKE